MYWVLCAVLIVFGLLGAASIGLPFLLLGLLLVALSGVRDRPARFWPPLVGMAAFFVPIIILLPFSCHGVDSADPNIASREWCTSLAGIEYVGGQGTAPSAWIALGSLAAGAVGYVSASKALRNSVSS